MPSDRSACNISGHNELAAGSAPDAHGACACAACGGQPRVIVVERSGRQTAVWMLALALAVVATALIVRNDRPMLPTAIAQMAGGGGAGARGIYAFTGQLTAKSYGLFMMDVDSGTVWCYELQRGANAEPQLKLVAARSWVYDRFLEEFNAADPVPSAVKMLVQQQRAGGGNAPPAGGSAPVPPPAATTAPALPSGPALPGPAGGLK